MANEKLYGKLDVTERSVPTGRTKREVWDECATCKNYSRCRWKRVDKVNILKRLKNFELWNTENERERQVEETRYK